MIQALPSQLGRRGPWALGWLSALWTPSRDPFQWLTRTSWSPPGYQRRPAPGGRALCSEPLARLLAPCLLRSRVGWDGVDDLVLCVEYSGSMALLGN